MTDFNAFCLVKRNESSLGQKKSFRRLLDKMRSAGGDALTLEEITREVESVRSENYAREEIKPFSHLHPKKY